MNEISLRRRRFVVAALVAVVALLVLLWWGLGVPLERAERHLIAGDARSAIDALHPWARLRLRPAQYEQLLSAAYLLEGEDEAAGRWLERAGGRRPAWFPAIAKQDLGEQFLARGMYEPFLRWDSAVRYRRESDQVKLYRAAAQLGAGAPGTARAILREIAPGAVDAERYVALERAISRREEGLYPLVVDRAGGTIAVWQMSNRDLVPVNTDFAALVDRSGGPYTIEANLADTVHTIETTLHPELQKAAIAALGNFRGSLVAIDPRTGEILAAASTAGGADLRNLAFEPEYEPGSIIKVLTGLAALEAGLDFSRVFPLGCTGFLTIEGRQFFDWARHATVPDLEEAMAVSCNVAFGDLGLRLGEPTLRRIMSKARFDEEVDLGLFRVPLGRHVRSIDDAYTLANYAIGLEVQKINSLHIAMLAAMVANDGVLKTPRLVRGRRTILGELVGAPADGLANTVVAPEVARRIVPSMRAVVTSPRGTGRRAAIDGLPIAMKTGTAGDAANGFDSIILAYAPVDKPAIAIGLIAQDSGPAELVGAPIARDFLLAARGWIEGR